MILNIQKMTLYDIYDFLRCEGGLKNFGISAFMLPSREEAGGYNWTWAAFRTEGWEHATASPILRLFYRDRSAPTNDGIWSFVSNNFRCAPWKAPLRRIVLSPEVGVGVSPCNQDSVPVPQHWAITLLDIASRSPPPFCVPLRRPSRPPSRPPARGASYGRGRWC
jgi:hypothetical protein